MAELKTRPTTASVDAFLAGVADEGLCEDRRDCQEGLDRRRLADVDRVVLGELIARSVLAIRHRHD